MSTTGLGSFLSFFALSASVLYTHMYFHGTFVYHCWYVDVYI